MRKRKRKKTRWKTRTRTRSRRRSTGLGEAARMLPCCILSASFMTSAVRQSCCGAGCAFWMARVVR